MARPLSGKQYTEAPDATYPFGRIKDKTSTEHGTPVNENVYGDFHQFFAQMANEAGVTLNGQPDNEYVGYQYVEALIKFIHKAISLPSGTDDLGTGSTNLNDFIKPGVYSITSSYTNKPSGLGATAQLFVSGTVGTSISQTIIDNTNGAEWARTYTAPATYSAWTLIKFATEKQDITNWDLDGSATKTVTITVSYTKVRGIRGLVRADTGFENNVYAFGSINSSGEVMVGMESLIGQTLTLRRFGTSLTGPNWNEVAGYVRGQVLVDYDPGT